MAKDLTDTERQRCLAIREFRRAYGISSHALAEAAGITPRWLIYIEQQQRAPTLDICRRVADILHIPLGAITSEALRHAVIADDARPTPRVTAAA